MKFFRGNNDTVYESVRASLDSAWGLPNDVGTHTCLPPVSTAPRDAGGKILLAVRDEFCQWEPAASMLPQLLELGAVEEIDAATYHAALPKSP